MVIIHMVIKKGNCAICEKKSLHYTSPPLKDFLLINFSVVIGEVGEEEKCYDVPCLRTS